MKLSMTLATIPLLLVAITATASAQSACDTDADCVLGFRCETVMESCPDIACPPGEEDCPEPLPCEPEAFSFCVPGPCASSSDCAAGLECLGVTSFDCPAAPPPCDPDDEGCDPPDSGDYDCTEVTESYCLPPYLAPCDVDADCGAGFTCEASEICSCSAGPGDEEPDCSCEPGGESYCQIIPVECTADSDCAADWTCEGAGGDVTCSYDPGTGEESCEPGPTTSYCVPPFFWDAGYAGDEAEGSPLDAATGGSESRVTEDIDRAEPSAGCSAAPGSSAGSAGAALLALAVLAIATLRRRG
jgi:MYXO-CTERM domain-containing protein